MNKNPKLKVPILCFIGAIFFSAFVLIEFHKDYIAVAGAGIVLLITAYFLVDKIENDLLKKYEKDHQNMLDKIDDTKRLLNDKSNEAQVIGKAVYVATNRGAKSIENELTQIANRLNRIEKRITINEANNSLRQDKKSMEDKAGTTQKI